jgi:dsDNA-specific endonuclease/ATPase MutS2
LLDSVQKALKDQEHQHGASVEEMAKEVNKTKEVLEKAEKELKQMVQLNKVGSKVLLKQSADGCCRLGLEAVSYSSHQSLGRVPGSYCFEVQACLPIPSVSAWVLWQDPI